MSRPIVVFRQLPLPAPARARPSLAQRCAVAFVVGLALGVALVAGASAQEAEPEAPRYEPTTRSAREVVRDTIAERAEAHGVSAAALTALAVCESHLDPAAVGDHGTSLGLMQLNTLPTGLYWHFLAVGYDDWRDAGQQADYVARVAAGHFPGIYLSRWSCYWIVRGGG